MRFMCRVSILFLLALVILSGCGQTQSAKNPNKRIKIGMMLSDYGLGDQSFNDNAFMGLIKARDELNITFDYRDLHTSHSYTEGFRELIEDEKCDLIIGLGFDMVEEATKAAKKYPNKQFVFIDQKIDLPNVTSIIFKEDEGSYLVGLIAGLKTTTNTVGFIGGMDTPLINRFRNGFIAGVRAVNPKAKIVVDYTTDFGHPEMGRWIARRMIEEKNVDIIFPAAGFSGLGALQEAADQQKYAIGVDTDQFYVAEKAVITSMVKNVDVAVFNVVKEYVEKGSLKERNMELGIRANGVGMAPIRITTLNPKEIHLVESFREQLKRGSISIKQ